MSKCVDINICNYLKLSVERSWAMLGLAQFRALNKTEPIVKI